MLYFVFFNKSCMRKKRKIFTITGINYGIKCKQQTIWVKSDRRVTWGFELNRKSQRQNSFCSDAKTQRLLGFFVYPKQNVCDSIAPKSNPDNIQIKIFNKYSNSKFCRILLKTIKIRIMIETNLFYYYKTFVLLLK